MDINFNFIFLTQKEIAAIMQISQPSASRIVQNIRLCKKLIRKTISLSELCEFENLPPVEAFTQLQKITKN